MSKYKCINCSWDGDAVVYPLDTCPVCGDWTKLINVPKIDNEVRVPVKVSIPEPVKVIKPVKKGGKK